MYPIMRGNYESPGWEFRNRRGLFSLQCRGQARWDDIADAYGPCHPCLELRSGKWAGKLKG